MVGADKFGKPLPAVERFHLPELGNKHCRACGVELRRPLSKVHIPPLLVNRVRLPRHEPKPRFLLSEAGCQHCLHHPVSLLANEIFLPHKHDHFVGLHREFSVCKSPDLFAEFAETEAAVNLLLRRDL